MKKLIVREMKHGQVYSFGVNTIPLHWVPDPISGRMLVPGLPGGDYLYGGRLEPFKVYGTADGNFVCRTLMQQGVVNGGAREFSLAKDTESLVTVHEGWEEVNAVGPRGQGLIINN